MPQANLKPETLRIVSTEDGLHLKDSILWLDAYSTGQLSFLSVARESIKNLLPQVIATEETVKVLEAFRKKPNALVCQYNRPFSIGQLKMELLPSGHSFGGALLYLETSHQSLLYAPSLQTLKIPTHRQLQLRKAKTLILQAHTPDPLQSPSKTRNREKEAFLDQIISYTKNGKWPLIFCKALPTAQEITKWLCEHDIPLAVHHQIYKVNKIYESYGSELGNYSQFSQRRSKNKVVLFPYYPSKKGKLPSSSDRPFLVIKNDLEPLPSSIIQDRIGGCFNLNASSYGADFNEVIEKVKPKEIYFFGPYSKQYCDSFKKNSNCTVKALFSNDQPPLF
ncbi:MAG: hypothetical protein AB8G05_04340 [Oligoflexales bacterium]